MTLTASRPAPPRPSARMSAAVIFGPEQFELRQVNIPVPGPRQVRIRVQGCGVCASNVPPWQGRPWFTYPLKPGQLGHEAWGIIDQLGAEVTQWQVGQRVAFLAEHGFAQYDVAADNQIVTIPDALDHQPVPGEPLGCAFNILARSDIQPHHTVAVVGVGFLGALLVQLIQRQGARVIALSRRQCSLTMAQRMGASHTVWLGDDPVGAIQAVRELTAQQLCPRVIEATGSQAGLDLAGQLVNQRGKLIVAGYHQDGPRQVNMQQWNWQGIDVINAHEREPWRYVAGMQEAIAALADGRLEPGPLYTHRFALHQLDQALMLASRRPDHFVKALVTMD